VLLLDVYGSLSKRWLVVVMVVVMGAVIVVVIVVVVGDGHGTKMEARIENVSVG